MRDEPRAVLRPGPRQEDWPVCRAHIEVIGFRLDCTRRRWHAMDGAENHLSSQGVEWSLDMALIDLDLSKARRELNP